MQLRHVRPDPYRIKRMLASVQAMGVADPAVLDAMASVPREMFVAPALRGEAYEDKTLPIGAQQTISAPSVVGAMTQALQLGGKEKVLEIGTGCGYQCAVLARLARRVFSIERIAELGKAAAGRLQALGFTNVVTQIGDGTQGWPAQAPFDAIIVTAAGLDVPPSLKQQLAVGGRMVIPVGAQEERQRLLRITRLGEDDFEEEMLGWVAFVPLIGKSA